MQQEDFGHLNFSINFYAFYDEKIERPSEIPYFESLSPFKYYMINEKEEKIQEIVKETKISILVPKNKKIKEENKIEEDKQEEDKKEKNKNEEEYEEDKRGELNSLNNNEKNRENNEIEKDDRKDNKEELGKVQKKEDEKNNIRIRKTKKEDNYELKEEVIIKGDSGIALSFFLTRGKYQLMKVFRKESINFEELFNHPELPAEEDLSEFIDILEDIYLDNREKFLSDSDSNVEYETRFHNSTETNFLPYGIPRLEKYD